MSNKIRRKAEKTKANPYNDIKLLFGVIISLLFIKKILKSNLKKNINFNMGGFALPLRYNDLQKHSGKHKRGFSNKIVVQEDVESLNKKNKK